jgi:hypothetical protein
LARHTITGELQFNAISRRRSGQRLGTVRPFRIIDPVKDSTRQIQSSRNLRCCSATKERQEITYWQPLPARRCARLLDAKRQQPDDLVL